MKKINYLFAILSISCLFIFQSCTQDECSRSQIYIQFEPVYLKVDEIRKDIKIEAPRSLKNPGKLYYYNQYIIINEVREGLHIIDNKNPASPQNIAFVKIPGNIDMAVKNNVLFVDNYIDLLAIDIQNPKQPKLISRTEDVFNSLGQNRDLGHLVYYKETMITEEVLCSDARWGNPWFRADDLIFVDQVLNSSAGAPQSNGLPASVSGVGGSMAQFTLYDHFLYVVDEWDLKVFDVEDCSNPNLANTVNVGWGIETIYPYQNKLFIGANDGMYIFDNKIPQSPTFISKFGHVRACDPVVVDGDIAYVTLRDGNTCEGFENQLDVVDVSTLTRPKLLKSFPMNNPHGLALKENKLFLCEGDAGLKSFDVTDWKILDDNQLAHIKSFFAYDVIALPDSDNLLVIGKDGLYQFKIGDGKNLKEISVIPVERD